MGAPPFTVLPEATHVSAWMRDVSALIAVRSRRKISLNTTRAAQKGRQSPLAEQKQSAYVPGFCVVCRRAGLISHKALCPYAI